MTQNLDLPCFSKELHATHLHVLNTEQWPAFLALLNPFSQQWLSAHAFNAKAKQVCAVPDMDGRLAFVVIGVGLEPDLYDLSDLPLSLPFGQYCIADSDTIPAHTLYLWSLGWGLGAYQFTRYKKASRAPAQLVLPDTIDQQRLQHELNACYWTRDLINTPASDLMPQDLSLAGDALATRFNGTCRHIIGDELLTHNYPMIHAVGRASVHAPRLIDLCFGAEHLPKVTLVGKGVCFDSGGLDIKPASGMLTMKKDMGGAAHVLGLAQLILAEQLPVRLRVLIPAVENAVGSRAFRPGDILTSRAGLTVEIGNTDAEGRLVLADALAEAVLEAPELLIDFATLTGAARIAVGTEIAAFFSNDEQLALAIQQTAVHTLDPSWRLPLFAPYKKMFKSTIADLNNATSSGYAGAITAALFLQAFVPDEIAWCHFDIMAFNLSSSSGKPAGGEAMGLRAAFEFLKSRYS